MLQLRNKNGSKGPLWLVEPSYSVGSDASCEIKILKNGVEPKHAEIHVSGDDIQIQNLAGSNVEVNGAEVEGKQAVKAGDVISIAGDEYEIVDPKANAAKLEPKPSTNSGWALKALNTALAEKQFSMTGTHVLGRSQECDISLGVVHLSRKHAKVTVTDRGLKVEDLNSSNGTYINGKKVSSAHAIAGDEISFDTLRFRVIGPVIDEDKTTMRPSSDGDLTTIRPAVKIPQSNENKPSAPKARPAPSTAAKPSSAKPAASHSSATSNASRSSESSSNTGVIVVACVVVIAGAVAAFFAMQ